MLYKLGIGIKIWLDFLNEIDPKSGSNSFSIYIYGNKSKNEIIYIKKTQLGDVNLEFVSSSPY
jgi:hypothetical protein